jgi:hypothetical protein
MLVRDSWSEMVWRSGIFEFCTRGSAAGKFEVVALVRFTFCIVRRNFSLGVQNPMVLHGTRRRLFGNCSLDAVRWRAILDGFTFIDFSLWMMCIAQLAIGCLMAWLSTLRS